MNIRSTSDRYAQPKIVSKKTITPFSDRSDSEEDLTNFDSKAYFAEIDPSNKLAAMGYNIEKKLGSGHYGNAFLLDNGRVLKVTRDDTEAKSANIVKNKHNLYNIYKVYRVFKFKSISKLYFIEQERLFPDEKFVDKAMGADFELDGKRYYIAFLNRGSTNVSYMSMIDDIFWFFNDTSNGTKYLPVLIERVNNLSSVIENEELIEELKNSDFTLDDVENYIKNAKVKKLYRNMLSAARELEELGIVFSDYHGGNILKDANGTYKVIDLGVSQSPASHIEQLENRIIKVRDLI